MAFHTILFDQIYRLEKLGNSPRRNLCTLQFFGRELAFRPLISKKDFQSSGKTGKADKYLPCRKKGIEKQDKSPRGFNPPPPKTSQIARDSQIAKLVGIIAKLMNIFYLRFIKLLLKFSRLILVLIISNKIYHYKCLLIIKSKLL